jgi:hypothetical protein
MCRIVDRIIRFVVSGISNCPAMKRRRSSDDATFVRDFDDVEEMRKCSSSSSSFSTEIPHTWETLLLAVYFVLRRDSFVNKLMSFAETVCTNDYVNESSRVIVVHGKKDRV